MNNCVDPNNHQLQLSQHVAAVPFAEATRGSCCGGKFCCFEECSCKTDLRVRTSEIRRLQVLGLPIFGSVGLYWSAAEPIGMVGTSSG